MKIHTTSGLYPNGDFKMNGVPSELLEKHIEYNRMYRPGRAFFVDGVCVHKGIGVSDEQITNHERLLKSDSNYRITKDTRPYV